MDVINFPDYKKWYKENKEFEIQEHTEMHNLSYIILIMITHTYLLKEKKTLVFINQILFKF